MYSELLDGKIVSQLKKVDALLRSSTNTDVEQVQVCIDNVVGSGGKRIRAILTLISFYMCARDHSDENDGIAIKTAAAIELIHDATLLHDDVVDNNNLRRGKKNIKSIYGNKVSILTGDFILSVAFNLIINLKNIDAVDVLACTARKLSEGEIRQLDLTGKVITKEQYLHIIESKTAILFASACEMSAILSKHADIRKILRDFGYNIGMAFQIIDDILDYEIAGDTGKEVGNDFCNGRFTLPCIIAYQNDASSKKFWEEKFFDCDNLGEIMSHIEGCNSIEISRNIAQSYIDKAKASLGVICKDNDLMVPIQKLMDFIIIRKR